jgi:hypothetical protein
MSWVRRKYSMSRRRGVGMSLVRRKFFRLRRICMSRVRRMYVKGEA